MGKNSAYYKDKQKKQIEQLEKLLDELPPLCKELIDFKKQTSAYSTLISYCYDLRIFFRYYLKQPECKVSIMQEISYKSIESIPAQKFLDFAKYLECSNNPEDWHQESKKGIHRKFASIRNLYNYHYRIGNIKYNPLQTIFLPKLTKDKAITTLTDNEIKKLFKALSDQKCFKRGRQRTYKKQTKHRDMAIVVLLLNTGIRVGECAGLDFTDVDMNECSVSIVRKGGAADKVFFNKNVRDTLNVYIKGERKETIKIKAITAVKEEQPFFYSTQGRRMTADSIERMVRAYTSRVIPYKHITPHKLRSTYGTALYKATGDIRLVGEVLGHENINTTIRYYAKFDDEKKRKAAKAVDFTKKTMTKEEYEKDVANNKVTESSLPNDEIKVTIDMINTNIDIANKRMEKEKKKEKNIQIIDIKKYMNNKK